MLRKGCFDSLYTDDRMKRAMKGPLRDKNRGNSQNPRWIGFSHDRGAILRASMAITQIALAHSNNGGTAAKNAKLRFSAHVSLTVLTPHTERKVGWPAQHSSQGRSDSGSQPFVARRPDSGDCGSTANDTLPRQRRAFQKRCNAHIHARNWTNRNEKRRRWRRCAIKRSRCTFRRTGTRDFSRGDALKKNGSTVPPAR